MLVCFAQLLFEFSGVPSVDQIDGGPAETSAGHACANQSLLLIRQVNHQIQLAAADLVKIAQAAVRLRHALSKSLEITRTQGLGAVQHARILAHDVQGALVNYFG